MCVGGGGGAGEGRGGGGRASTVNTLQSLNAKKKKKKKGGVGGAEAGEVVVSRYESMTGGVGERGVDEFNSTKRNYRREELGYGGGWRGGEGGLAENPVNTCRCMRSAPDQLAISWQSAVVSVALVQLSPPAGRQSVKVAEPGHELSYKSSSA